MGSDPVLSLDFNSRGEKPIIKCHWNFALQHDDISQKGGQEAGGGKAVRVEDRPWWHWNVAIWRRLGSVFQQQMTREERAGQSAGTKMAFILHFSSLYHVHRSWMEARWDWARVCDGEMGNNNGGTNTIHLRKVGATSLKTRLVPTQSTQQPLCPVWVHLQGVNLPIWGKSALDGPDHLIIVWPWIFFLLSFLAQFVLTQVFSSKSLIFAFFPVFPIVTIIFQRTTY